MANHYRQFAVAVRLRGKLAAAWITEMLRDRQKAWQQLVDAEQHDAADAIGIDFDWMIDDGQLHLTDNGEHGNVEHVDQLLRELIRIGYVQEPVAIHWADTCSRHRPGEFTGGAALVTKRRTYWFVLPELVEKKVAALERRRRASGS